MGVQEGVGVGVGVPVQVQVQVEPQLQVEEQVQYKYKQKYKYCITGNRTFGFICLPSHKIIVYNFVYIVNPVVSQRSSWEMYTHLGCYMCRVFRPLPHIFTCLLCRESYIDRVLRNNSSVHSLIVTRVCDTLFLNASSSSSTATSSSFLTIPQERVS